MATTFTINLTFPGDVSATDVTSLVRYGSFNETLIAYDDKSKASTIDTVSFHLNEDATVRGKFLATDGTSRILCTVDDGGVRRFTGYIAPTFATLHYDILDGFGVTAEDASYLLDRPIKETISIPTVVGGDQYYVYQNSGSRSLIHELLESAGYNATTDIDTVTNVDIDYFVQHFAIEEDESTYREVIDQLLYEYRYSFRFNADGKFQLVKWSHDSLTTVETFNKSNILSSSGLSAERREILEDGARVKYAILDRIDDVRLYYATSPPNTNPAEFAFQGWPIAPGDYYPPDSDIEDIYQTYRDEWLDVPYQTRQTRLKNKDIDLVSSSGQRLIYNSDAGIAVDLEEYEPFRARVRFVNNAAEIRKLYAFEILGTALFRDSVRTASYPTTTSRPFEYVTRFVFDNVSAQDLAISIGRDLVFGSFAYSWVSETAVTPGELVEIVDPDIDIDTTVAITERQYNDQTGYYSYTGIGVTLFSTDSVLTEGQTSANSGIQEQTELLNIPTFGDIEGGEILVASYQYPSTAPAARNCNGDNDEADINAAIQDLVDTFGGGRVKLTRGIYNIDAPIVVQSGISIEGDGASTIVRLRGANAQVRIGIDASDVLIGASEVQIRNVKVERLEVAEVDGGDPATVYSLSVDGGTPSETLFDGGSLDGGTPASAYSQSTVELLQARSATDVWLIDSIYQDSYGDGLRFVNANNITLRNCQVLENDGYGIVVRGAVVDGGDPTSSDDLGAVAHYKLDGDATDSAGANDGTAFGVTYEDSPIGKAGLFDGVDDYIEADIGSGTLTQDFTVSYWLKSDGVVNGYGFVSYGGATYGFIAGYAATNAPFVNCIGSTGAASCYNTNFDITDGTWHHCVLTYDGITSRSYVDGVEMASTTTYSGPLRSTSDTKIRIGTWYSTLVQDGLIDDVRIFDRALTADEVTALYTDPAAPVYNWPDPTLDGGAPSSTYTMTTDGGAPDDTFSLNCIISECYVTGNLDGIWFVGDDGLIIDNYITNNTFDGCVVSGTDNQFHGNYVTGNGDNGLVVSGNNNSAVGTRAKNNGGAGITISGDLAVINGCVVQSNTTGILVQAAADNTVLTGNAASGNGTNYTDNGTATISTGNNF